MRSTCGEIAHLCGAAEENGIEKEANVFDLYLSSFREETGVKSLVSSLY